MERQDSAKVTRGESSGVTYEIKTTLPMSRTMLAHSCPPARPLALKRLQRECAYAMNSFSRLPVNTSGSQSPCTIQKSLKSWDALRIQRSGQRKVGRIPELQFVGKDGNEDDQEHTKAYDAQQRALETARTWLD